MSQRLIAILMKQTQQMIQARQPVSDAVLLHQFSTERDETAFAGLVQRHGPMVWAVCRNSLRCESDAEDAFQATFLALVRKAHRIRNKLTVAAWLHGVAVRVCLKVRESSARRLRREAKAAITNRQVVSDGVWYDELTRVHELIRQLPRHEHEVFVLCGLEGLPQSEVARRFDLKLTSVSGILARARKRLQSQLRSDTTKSLLALTVAACSPALVPAALLSQTCSLARSTAGLSVSILFLANYAMEVPMRKLLILTVCGLILSSGMTIRSFVLTTAEGQAPKPGQNTQTVPQPSVNYWGQSLPQQASRSKAGNKWEYKMLRCSVGALEAQANALGEDSWELCSTSPGSESSHIVCIFKRPKTETVNQSSTPTPRKYETVLSYSLDSLAEKPTEPAQTTSSDYLVFNLKKANASDLATTLRSALKNVVIVIDPKSNSVHIQCPNADASAIKLLVETLDKTAKQDTQSQPPTKH